MSADDEDRIQNNDLRQEWISPQISVNCFVESGKVMSNFGEKYIVIGDIGGTNCRLELVLSGHFSPHEKGNCRPTPLCSARYRTSSATSVLQLLERFSGEKCHHTALQEGEIVLYSLSVCGPVNDGTAVLTAQTFGDGGWTVNSSELSAILGCPVTLVNDFQAVGMSLLRIPREAIHTLYAGTARTGHPHSITAWLGPGTGLGEGYAVWVPRSPGACEIQSTEEAGEWRLCASEGGMSDFVPRSADEWALRKCIALQGPSQSEYGFVDVEHVVSGTGIMNIYKWLRRAHPELMTNPVLDNEIMSCPEEGARHICQRAAARQTPSAITHTDHFATYTTEFPDPLIERTLDMFLAALGAEASNMALRFQALGGVYIAGGITNKIIDIITDGRVARAYLDKAHSVAAYSACPLYAVGYSGDELGMSGAYLHALKHYSLRC